MKITKQNLERIIDIVLQTPTTLIDYCYYDGCPTDWNRGLILNRKDGETITYHCLECGTKRHYNIARLKAEYDNNSHHGDTRFRPPLLHDDFHIKEKGGKDK